MQENLSNFLVNTVPADGGMLMLIGCMSSVGTMMTSFLQYLQEQHMNGYLLMCYSFFRRNLNMYLLFMLFLHTDMAQVVEILSHVRLRPVSGLHSQYRGC